VGHCFVLAVFSGCAFFRDGAPLSPSAFRRALHQWGIDMSDHEYIKFWRKLDKNKDNTMSFGEFCKVVARGSAMPDAKVWNLRSPVLFSITFHESKTEIVQKPLPPRTAPDAGQEFRMAVLFDAERRVANQIIARYGSVGKALSSFDRNKNGVVRGSGCCNAFVQWRWIDAVVVLSWKLTNSVPCCTHAMHRLLKKNSVC
jgi:hypothetical protein